MYREALTQWTWICLRDVSATNERLIRTCLFSSGMDNLIIGPPKDSPKVRLGRMLHEEVRCSERTSTADLRVDNTWTA